MVGTYVPSCLAARFKGWARTTDGGAAAALRRLISEAIDGRRPASGHQVLVRLKDSERLALLRAAKARSTTPENWLRSLAIVHLGRRPQWDEGETAALREIGQELRGIGNNVNQIARALNVAAQTGAYPVHQGVGAKAKAVQVRAEMRRLIAIHTGNFDYWGLPEDERPSAAYGAMDKNQARERDVAARRNTSGVTRISFDLRILPERLLDDKCFSSTEPGST